MASLKIDYKLLYEQDEDFAKFCDEIILSLMLKDDDFIKQCYFFYQSGINKDQVSSFISYFTRYNDL